MKTALIVGGGFAGCTAANMLKQKGYRVKLVEKTSTLGGGCRTFFHHGHPYTYGPHHLLINIEDRQVYDYMSQYLDLREIEHYNMTYVAQDQAFYTFPIHRDEVDLMPDRDQIQTELSALPESCEAKNFEEFWLHSVGTTLYNKFINSYSKKMWQIDDNTKLDEFTFSFKNKREDSLKTGSKKCFDGKKKVYYPRELDGYNSYFSKCVEGCEVLNQTPVTEFDMTNRRIKIAGSWQSAEVIVSTVSVDALFSYKYGVLPYVGRDFLKIVLPVERVTPEPYFFIHYANEEPYTRIFEYKLLTGYTSPHTLIIVETPSFNNKLYPYPILQEIQKAQRYLNELPENVFSIGRMGKYHYDNMDMIIKDCFSLFAEL